MEFSAVYTYTLGYVEYDMAVAYTHGQVTDDELFEEAERNMRLVQHSILDMLKNFKPDETTRTTNN